MISLWIDNKYRFSIEFHSDGLIKTKVCRVGRSFLQSNHIYRSKVRIVLQVKFSAQLSTYSKRLSGENLKESNSLLRSRGVENIFTADLKSSSNLFVQVSERYGPTVVHVKAETIQGEVWKSFDGSIFENQGRITYLYWWLMPRILSIVNNNFATDFQVFSTVGCIRHAWKPAALHHCVCRVLL